MKNDTNEKIPDREGESYIRGYRIPKNRQKKKWCYKIMDVVASYLCTTYLLT